MASLVALVILSPVFVLIVLAIIIEGFLIPKNRGPVFYTETRMSQGKPFTLRKFRIFKTSAYEPIRRSGAMVHTKKIEHDPANLTWTGNLLKKFYLDESPQLASVLFGDLSMVGTRPWNPADYQREVEKGILRKKNIKAGLTGPVQIHKRNAKAYGGEHKLDSDYGSFCKTHSGFRVVLHDAWLLLQSVAFMLRGQGL